MPGETYPCRRFNIIGTESEELIREIHSPEYVFTNNESLSENQMIVAISSAMRDLLLHDREGNADRAKLHQRYLEMSKILQLILVISLAEGAALDDLYDDISKAIARLLADIYSGC